MLTSVLRNTREGRYMAANEVANMGASAFNKLYKKAKKALGNLPKNLSTMPKRKPERALNIFKQAAPRKKSKTSHSYSSAPSSSAMSGVIVGKKKGKGKKVDGKYKGKFKKTQSIKKYNIKSMLLSKGFHMTLEQYGDVADPDCVYLHHGTWNDAYLAKVIIASLVRTLFRKAGVYLGSSCQEIPSRDWDASDGWRIEYITRAIGGQQFSANFEITENQTFNEVIEDLSLTTMGHIINSIQNEQVANETEPHALNLYMKDTYGTGVEDYIYRLKASMPLQNTKIEIHAKSEVKLQNRTKGATSSASGEELAIDRVDNQPIVGKLYDFKHADMRLRYTDLATNLPAPPGLAAYRVDNFPLDRAGAAGLYLLRAADFEQYSASANGVALKDYQNPPVPSFWTNCSGAVNVRLEPGMIKKMYVSHKFTGYLPSLLKKIACKRQDTFFVWRAPGKSQLIALEEIIRTASTNNITIAYERRYEIGAVATYNIKKQPFTSLLAVAPANNVPS